MSSDRPILGAIGSSVVVALVLFCVGLSSCHCGGSPESQGAMGQNEWNDEELSRLAQFVAATWRQESAEAPSSLGSTVEAAYVVARSKGLQRAKAWSEYGPADQSISSAIEDLRRQLGSDWLEIDSFDIFVAAASEEVDPLGDRQRIFSNNTRGLLGLAIEHDGVRTLFSPTYAIASNRRKERQVELYKVENELTEGVVRSLKYWLLHGPQFYVKLSDTPTARKMHRGNTLVPIGNVVRDKVLLFADRMAAWMWNNLDSEGKMTYIYWPSLGKEARGDHNLIRQLNATIALIKVAAITKNPEYAKRSADNIQYNLDHHYIQERAFGRMELRGKSNLGALALMALAIVQHPERARWSEQEIALRRSISKLWQKNGSFDSYVGRDSPPNDHDFFAGNALLLWATLYAETPNTVLLSRFMKSFEFYKNWHFGREAIEYEFDEVDGGPPRPSSRPIPDRRQPVFIPKHTQAYALMWQQTKNPQLLAVVFKMNDWLVGVQEWPEGQEGIHNETAGRFYDTERGFGAPSSASTGQYIESLVAAYELAVIGFDGQRKGVYSQSIRRGLRYLMQLQFVDDVDMFYALDPKRTLGGLRSAVYDNQIRCDNVQHALMASLVILQTEIVSP